MMITKEQRQTLIDRNNAIIEMCSNGTISEVDQLDIQNARIALAALEAEPIGYHREDAREAFRVLPYDDGVYKIAVYAVQPVPVLHLPQPISEEDGYRLNTSWHAGAIFRDGANWMLEQAKQMQPPLAIRLPDTSSKAFWHGSGKAEVFLPEAYKRWVKEAIERDCTIARVNVEVK